jgi:hypothetical protein
MEVLKMLYVVGYNGEFVGFAIDYEQAVSMIIGIYGICDSDKLFLEELDFTGCNEICDLCQYGDECASSTLLEEN